MDCIFHVVVHGYPSHTKNDSKEYIKIKFHYFIRKEYLMRIFEIKITLRAEWVHSLKEKRMIVQSLKKRLINEFQVSAIEAEQQDIHQIIVIAVVGLAGSEAIANSIIEAIINYVESNTDAELIEIAQDVEQFLLRS